MSLGQQSTNAGKLPPGNADAWVVAPDVHLGPVERLREIWRYRRILSFFAVRAIQGLYKNTKLGVGWLVIRPLAPVLVGSVVFGSVMGAPSNGVPYFLFLLTGSVAWSFFEDAVIRGSRGLEVNRQLLTKLYLPRVILPAGQLAGGLVQPVVLAAMLVVAVWYYRLTAGVWYSMDPTRLPVALLAVLLSVVCAFAVTLWTSVWQARARDVRYILGYVLNFWFFLTPVIYPLSAMPEQVRWVARLNPMTGPVEAFKWSVLGIGAPDWTALGISTAGIGLVLGLGLWYFAGAEGQTVDRL